MECRWLVISITEDKIESPIVGNSPTRVDAESTAACLKALSGLEFKIIGPISVNMIKNQMTEGDVDLVEAELEANQLRNRGAFLH